MTGWGRRAAPPRADEATDDAEPVAPERASGLARLSLKGRALKLLSMREHSRLELERKLRAHETQAGELAALLDALAARGFISDERVADSVLHRRAGKLGASRVKAELQAKGLDEAVVREAVEQLRGSEVERAREVWRKKFSQPPTDAKERAKQIRFLAARGFSGEAVRRAIEGGEEERD